MAKSAPKLSKMVGDIFEYYYSHMAKVVFRLSTMVGEMFKYQ